MQWKYTSRILLIVFIKFVVFPPQFPSYTSFVYCRQFLLFGLWNRSIPCLIQVHGGTIQPSVQWCVWESMQCQGAICVVHRCIKMALCDVSVWFEKTSVHTNIVKQLQRVFVGLMHVLKSHISVYIHQIIQCLHEQQRLICLKCMLMPSFSQTTL